MQGTSLRAAVRYTVPKERGDLFIHRMRPTIFSGEDACLKALPTLQNLPMDPKVPVRCLAEKRKRAILFA